MKLYKKIVTVFYSFCLKIEETFTFKSLFSNGKGGKAL